jgi:hypothetical protein
MEQPSAEHPLKVIACRLSPSLIAEAQRYADLHHSSVSTLLREGLELRLQELRLQRVAFSSSSAVPTAMSPATVAMLRQLASTLNTAAEEVRSVCQQHLEGEMYNGNTIAIGEMYNGNTPLEEAYNGNTPETLALEPTTESAAEEMETATPAQTPDAREPRQATKRGKRSVSPTHADVSPPAPALVPDTDIPAFDTSKYSLGKLCPRGHDYHGTGQSLLRLPQQHCRQCDTEQKRERRQRQAKSPAPPAARPATPIPVRRAARSAGPA